MTTIPDVHVRPDGDSWIVTVEGLDEPIERFDEHQPALDAARREATKRACELFIHDADDRIAEVVPRYEASRAGEPGTGRPLIAGRHQQPHDQAPPRS